MPDVISGGSGREWPVWTPRRVRVAVVATSLLALAATAFGGYLAGERRPDSPPATGGGEAESAAVAKLDIPGGRPSGARLAYGSIWVTTWDGHVVRVDPETREIGDPIPVGEGPLATNEGFGSVWVTSAYQGAVTRINPVDNSVLDTISVGPSPFQLAPAGGGMWVATQDAAVKIDPVTDDVVHRVPYPRAPAEAAPSQAGVGLAADENGVWISTAVGTLLRLAPDDGHLVEKIRVLPNRQSSPGSVVIDGDKVWVSNWAIDTGAGPGAGEPILGRSVSVVQIDAGSNQIVRRVPTAGYPVAGMLPVDDTLYMVGSYGPGMTSVLIRADWPYQVLTSVQPVGRSSFDVVAANGSLWVPSFEEDTLYVLDEAGG
jgi:streptogramin lyase